MEVSTLRKEKREERGAKRRAFFFLFFSNESKGGSSPPYLAISICPFNSPQNTTISDFLDALDEFATYQENFHSNIIRIKAFASTKVEENFFRYYVDRVFSSQGSGTVVTGTVLGKDISIDTGITAGSISFSNSVDGNYLLSLAGGTGDIKLEGAVGSGTSLSGLKVASAGGVTFDGAVSVDDEGIDITSTTVDINNTVTTTNSGIAKFTNSGLLTVGSAVDMTLDGGFTQEGTGLVSLAGDITTSSDNISFASGVTLSGGASLGTGSGGGAAP